MASLHALSVFMTVVDKGSFSQAGKTLNVAPSSISRTIDGLEQALNVNLFERTTRQLKLTEQGLILVEGAAKLLEQSEQLKRSLHPNAQPLSGHLSVSVFESFGREYVCPFVPLFLNRHPNIQLQLEFENDLKDLVSNQIDVAIRVGVPDDSSLKARRLFDNRTVVCASRAYIDQFGAPSHPNELQSHNCLCLNRHRQRTYWYFEQPDQSCKIQVKGRLSSKGGTPLAMAAEAGLGIVQLPFWMVSNALKKGTLVPMLEDWRASLSQNNNAMVYAVYKQTTFPNPLVSSFIHFLVEQYESVQ